MLFFGGWGSLGQGEGVKLRQQNFTVALKRAGVSTGHGKSGCEGGGGRRDVEEEREIGREDWGTGTGGQGGGRVAGGGS